MIYVLSQVAQRHDIDMTWSLRSARRLAWHRRDVWIAAFAPVSFTDHLGDYSVRCAPKQDKSSQDVTPIVGYIIGL